MEERYEIRGKIGQGGLGAVYRGYDTRMNREVAIKRISTNTEEDPELQEESTRQLIKEAGALASLQHPHIVTIYDVGSDEDGPYVVMELISGKTLDELIERAPLTWPDFRELALQTQEALIAAQELDLIHSDIKPSNLMLTWLPSGKFQVKIVDFGLATLTHTQSKEELEELEAVFGSIFFMAPEQFERVPLDARTDIYAMACVYYQALTGIYPFDGKTGSEVMTAHLNHQVTPLQDVRSDIPVWACDWIMWQINRQAADRPASSREALQVFLQNDKVPNPKLSLGTPTPTQSMQRPLQTHGGSPQTIRLPRPSTPATRVQLGQQPVPQAPIEVQIPVPSSVGPPTTVLNQPEPAKTKTAPQPLLPPEGSKPSVHTAPQPLPKPGPPLTSVMQAAHATAPIHTGPIYVAATNPIPPEFFQSKKRGMSNGMKTTIGVLAGVAALAIALLLIMRGSKGKEGAEYAAMIALAGQNDSTELVVDKAKLDILLRATSAEATSQAPLLYKALAMAKAKDATDVDSAITDFAVKTQTLPMDIRTRLIRDVVGKRKNPAAVPALLELARSASEPPLAVAAVQAIRFTATEEQFRQLVEIVQTTANDDVRKAAEETMAVIIGKSTHRSLLGGQLGAAYIVASNTRIRESFLRLAARCGGEQATLLVKSSLNNPDRDSKSAAISALGVWPDESNYPILLDLLATTQDSILRSQAFDAALTFVSEPARNHRSNVAEGLWTQLAPLAQTSDQQKKLITAITDYGTETWAYQIISSFAKNTSNDATVIQLAEQTLNRLRAKN